MSATEIVLDEKLCETFKLPEEKNDIDSNQLNDLCSICNGYGLVNEENLIVCKLCGTIDRISFDTGGEWRYYGSEDNKYIKQGRLMLQLNKNAKQFIIDKASHNTHLENTDMFTHVISNMSIM